MAQKADGTLASIALSMVRGVDAAVVRHIEECGLTPADFFSLSDNALADALGMRRQDVWNEHVRDEAVFRARQELDQISRYRLMRPLFLLDDDYPEALGSVPDAPVVIYVLGNCKLDRLHSVSVVGTRKATPYGLDFARRIVEELAGYFPDLMVVSGMANGIDSAAHIAALKSGRDTVGVMAHGLHIVYPAINRQLAKQIIDAGGALISEYPLGTTPFRGRFLERNRIVAALSPVTIVVESDIRGGAMSTAYTADSYHREVMALPGRVGDPTSAGCNLLIRRGKAQLITCAADFIEHTGWAPLNVAVDCSRRNLFPELDGDARIIYDVLRQKSDALTIDELCVRTGLNAARLLAELTELEADGVIARHSGGRYTAL
ncbi:MAG: DNA-processing protein DprA [Muribaculaceae bacterium]|nr:DNA-processing protein DprA [Muribaculaceae bacterium]